MKRFFLFLIILLTIVDLSYAHDLEPLHVDGRYLKNPSGNIVTLHGLQQCVHPWIDYMGAIWSGDDYEGAVKYNKEWIDSLLIVDWKIDYLRLQIGAEWIVNRETNNYDLDYFKQKGFFDKVYVPLIEYMNSKGIYAVLYYDGIRPAEDEKYQIGDMPQRYALEFWDYVSSHPKIKNNPGVMMELFNEPPGFLGNDGHVDDFRDVKNYFQPMIDIIRENGCQCVIWVPGIGQVHFNGFATNPMMGENIGYAFHAYPWWGISYESLNKPWWDREIVPVGNMAPLMMTETYWWNENPDVNETSEFGIGLKNDIDRMGNVSWNLLTDHSWDVVRVNEPSTDGSKTEYNDDEIALVPTWNWFKEYADSKILPVSQLKAVSVEMEDAPTSLYPGESRALKLMAKFDNGNTWNVAGDVVWSSSDEDVLSIDRGNIYVKKEGLATLRGTYTDGTGKNFETQFEVNCCQFPLTSDGVSYNDISFPLQFDEESRSFSGEGVRGWSSVKGFDFSAYHYLVVRLVKEPDFGAEIWLEDGSGEQSRTTLSWKTGEVIDLQAITGIDMTHIKKVLFWVWGGPLLVKEIFLSNDGVNPITEPYTIRTLVNADDKVMHYGDEVPELTYSVVGSDLSQNPILSTTVTTESAVGTYDILITGNEDGVDYYPGKLHVIPAPCIAFADDAVKAICVANWDTNSDGELSYAEAAAVTDLGRVFMNNTSIVSFDELQYFTGLEYICDRAFYNCSGLTSITIPNSVESIGEQAFAFCSSIAELILPPNVSHIGSYAFYKCSSMTSINIPSKILIIEEGTFRYCSNLKSLVIEDSSSYLYCHESYYYNSDHIYSCFYDCPLESVYLGRDLQNHQSEQYVSRYLGFFYGKNNLSSLEIGDNVTSIKNYMFYNCVGLSSVSLPNSVTSIGTYAFSGCKDLTTIAIPEKVTYIGSCAFYYSGLTSVTVDIESPLSIDAYTFTTRADATLYVPYGCKAAYEAADYWKEFKEIVEMPGPAISDLSELSNSKLYTLTDTYGTLRVNGNTLENSAIILDPENMGLVTNVSQLSSPYTEPTEGSLAELLDNNAETYWHSIWTGGEVAPHTHYLQVDLIESVNENICLQVSRRQTINDHITQWGVYGSNNATAADGDWEELASISMPYGCYTETRPSVPFDTKGYRYLRFYIDNTTGEDNGPTRGFGHLSEFRLFKASELASYAGTDNRENSQFAILKINNKYYLYSPAMRAFWLAQGTFCPGFGSAITVTSDDYGWTLTMPFDGQTVSLNYTGSPYRITPVADFDPTEALAAFAENTILGLSDGYYRIHHSSTWGSNIYASGSIDSGGTLYASWCTLDDPTNNAATLWHLTNCDGYYDLQNVYTQGRFTSITKSSRAVMDPDSESLIAIDRVTERNGKRIVNIRVASQNMGDTYYLHQPEGYDNMVGWYNTGTNGSTEWIFEPVSDEEVETITNVEVTDISQLDNAIYIDRTEGVAGSSVSLAIKIKNNLLPVGCSFKLKLPEGFSLVKDSDGDVIYELSDRTKKMSVTMQDWNNGSYDFALMPSTETATISGNDGAIIAFRIQVPEGKALGDYKVSLTNNLILSKVSGTTEDYVMPNVKTTFTVVNYILGDVNGDGNITPSDAVMILYHYFNVPQEGFREAAADINKDGNISPSDAIEALYLYFGVGNSNAVRSFIDTLDPQ